MLGSSLPLQAPRRAPPVDLAANLALLPTGATCKGMAFNDLIRRVARVHDPAQVFARAHLLPRTYQAFLTYPMHDQLRLTVAAAEIMSPGAPLGEALRHLGRDAFPTFADSNIGRVMFGVFETEVERILLAAPRAFKTVFNFGDLSAEVVTTRKVRLRARGLPILLETYQVGVIEGVFQRCKAQGRVAIALEDPATALLEATW